MKGLRMEFEIFWPERTEKERSYWESVEKDIFVCFAKNKQLSSDVDDGIEAFKELYRSFSVQFKECESGIKFIIVLERRIYEAICSTEQEMITLVEFKEV